MVTTIDKKAEKAVSEIYVFLDTLPEALFLALGSQNGSKKHIKSVKIASGTEKRDFVKIVLFLRRQHDFRGSEPPKIHEKATKIGAKKQARKMFASEGDFNAFWAILAPPGGGAQKPPESAKNEAQKTDEKKGNSDRQTGIFDALGGGRPGRFGGAIL